MSRRPPAIAPLPSSTPGGRGRVPHHEHVELDLPASSGSAPESLPRFFDFHRRGWPYSGFAIQREGRWLAYVNRCAHLPLSLDLGDEDILSEDGEHAICHNHGARFRLRDGYCVWGPCEGQRLEPLPVAERPGGLRVDLSGVDVDRPLHPDYEGGAG